MTPEQQLADLREQMAGLVAERQRVRSWATTERERIQRIVSAADTQFDTLAIPIGREIAKLEAELAPAATAPKVRHKTVVMDGLTEAQKQVYRELLAKGA